MPIPPPHSIGDLGHTSDHNDIVEALDVHDFAFAGPPFRSVLKYDALAESAVLAGGGDCETTTGWSSTNIASLSLVTRGAPPAGSGTKAVHIASIPVSWDGNPSMNAQAHRNLDSATARGEYGYLAIDAWWKWTSTPVEPWTVRDFVELVVSSEDDFGGDVVVHRMPRFPDQTWTTLRVPIDTLTEVKCVGMRTYATITEPDTVGQFMHFDVDFFRFASQTEVEAAIIAENPTTVIVPPGFTGTGTQGTLDIPEGRALLDVRPEYMSAGFGNRKHSRQFQIPEDETTDCTQLMNEMFSLLDAGDILDFTPGARYLITDSMVLSGLRNVTINFNGAKFFTNVAKPDGSALMLANLTECLIDGPRVYGYNPVTDDGSTMEVQSGSPTFNVDDTIELSTIGDAVRLSGSGNGWGLNPDDVVPFEWTVSQSADPNSVTRDLRIEIVDGDAPTDAPTATAHGTEGPVAPGDRWYVVTFVDIEGNETTASPGVFYTNTVGASVIVGLPLPTGNEEVRIVGRRVYRSRPAVAAFRDDPRAMKFVEEVPDITSTTLLDVWSDAGGVPSGLVTIADAGAGNVEAGIHQWMFTTVSANGTESITSARATFTVTGGSRQLTITVPLGPAGTTKRKVYRTLAGVQTTNQLRYGYVGSINDNVTTTMTDNVADGSRGDPATDRTTAFMPPVRFIRDITPTNETTTFPLTWDKGESRNTTYVVARKLTSAVNTITIESCFTTTRAQYTELREGVGAVVVSKACQDITVRNVFATVVGSDAVTVQPGANRVVVEDVISNGVCRQGVSIVGGDNITFRRMRIIDPGRSAIDIEPTSDQRCSNIVIEDIDVINASHASLAMNNWPKIRNLTVKRMHTQGGGDGAFTGGAIVGSIEDVTCLAGLAILGGQNMMVTNLTTRRMKIVDSTFTVGDTGGHFIDHVMLTHDVPEEQIELEIDNLILGDNIFIISGPQFTPTITRWTPP